MPVIEFKSSPTMKVYHDRPLWADGDRREVAQAHADNLTHSFPHNFTLVVEEKAVEKPDNKAITSHKTKARGRRQ